jgi:hypothetical protein
MNVQLSYQKNELKQALEYEKDVNLVVLKCVATRDCDR